MNHKHVALAIVAAAAFAVAPSFAQQSAAVRSDTGVTFSQPNDASVTVTPHTAAAVPTARLMPGGTMQPYASTTVLGGPSGPASKTVTTHYWVNVPADAQNRLDFRRWQRLVD